MALALLLGTALANPCLCAMPSPAEGHGCCAPQAALRSADACCSGSTSVADVVGPTVSAQAPVAAHWTLHAAPVRVEVSLAAPAAAAPLATSLPSVLRI